MVQTKDWLFRNTASAKGRNISITPQTSAFKDISAGRIILDKTTPKADGRNDRRETTLLCLHGNGKVKVGGEEFSLGRLDGIYIGRGEPFEVSTNDFVDIVEAS